MADPKVNDMLVNPSREFSHPSQVLTSKDLSRIEKAKVLKQWELDARLLQVASEEGMTGGEPNMLADVKKAQEELGVDLKPAATGAPNKNGM